MTSLYPFLFKAFYNWLAENQANPRLIVDATKNGVKVPQEYVSNGMILLSIYHLYVSNLVIGPTDISFNTRFKGKQEHVVIPYYAMAELLCSEEENPVCIPLSGLLASIDLYCNHADADIMDEDAIITELANREADVAKSYKKISFTVEKRNEEDNATPAPSTRGRPKKKPNFTVIE